MSSYTIKSATLTGIADATRALTGRSDKLTAEEMVQNLKEIRVRRYDGEYVGEKISGIGQYLAMVVGEELKEHRSDDELKVTIYFHVNDKTQGALKKIIAGNGENTSYHSDSAKVTKGTRQLVERWSASGESLNAYGQTDYRLDDESTLNIGTGHTYITPEGELRVYDNANSYFIAPCKWTVIVEW